MDSYWSGEWEERQMIENYWPRFRSLMLRITPAIHVPKAGMIEKAISALSSWKDHMVWQFNQVWWRFRRDFDGIWYYFFHATFQSRARYKLLVASSFQAHSYQEAFKCFPGWRYIPNAHRWSIDFSPERFLSDNGQLNPDIPDSIFGFGYGRIGVPHLYAGLSK
ncbi:hypothetical protein C8J56DRAFT_896487 [Mycena floridula]|nr:hypothetical protein C8J56DRAFT_896487 [Mycena floridula]